jgi:hypothetical protein
VTYRALLVAALCAGGIALPQSASASPQGSIVILDSPSSEEAPSPTQVGSSSVQAAAPVRGSLPQWGVQLDAGLMDFLGLNAVYRPLPFLRFHGGPLFNGAGLGVRGGLSLVPFHFVITPALTLEAGHYFPGDVSGWLPDTGIDPRFNRVLEQLSYTFYSGQLGLEVGVPDRFAIYLRGGLTWLNTELKGSGQAFQELAGDETLQIQDFRVRGTVPSFKLGLLFYLG